MGIEQCMLPNILRSSDLSLPNLVAKSQYQKSASTTKFKDQTIKQSQQIFPLHPDQVRNLSLIENILSTKQRVFTDHNYELTKENTKFNQQNRLSMLFDFARTNSRVFTTKDKTQLKTFTQLDIELAYLTCVLYQFCNDKKLLKGVVETQEVNDLGIYSTWLYPNGSKTQVIVDDYMPTISDSFIYLRIVKGIELWPLILEKAWTKLIGSYEKAKGLSPEDAYEEISGIPARSFRYEHQNRSMVKKMIQQAFQSKFWVSLVARNNLEDLKNRHVFYLEQIENDKYVITSPFSAYSFGAHRQENKNKIAISEQQLFGHFQFVIIGFAKIGYCLKSIEVESRKSEELLFEIVVRRAEPISIRFNQFYSAYLQQEERDGYKYSPVLMELYRKTKDENSTHIYELIEECQGCPRSLAGARSVQLCPEIFERLSGKYFLRLEIDWQHESIIRKGNLGIYCSEGNVEVEAIHANCENIIQEIYSSILLREDFPKEQISFVQKHGLEIRTINKLYSAVICFRNCYNSPQRFQVDFTTSQNVRFKYQPLVNGLIMLELDSSESKIMEISPLDCSLPMSLQNFEVTKLTDIS